jgi:ABC-type branched-subunit amino acid transport system ATPase component
MSGISK